MHVNEVQKTLNQSFYDTLEKYYPNRVQYFKETPSEIIKLKKKSAYWLKASACYSFCILFFALFTFIYDPKLVKVIGNCANMALYLNVVPLGIGIAQNEAAQSKKTMYDIEQTLTTFLLINHINKGIEKKLM